MMITIFIIPCYPPYRGQKVPSCFLVKVIIIIVITIIIVIIIIILTTVAKRSPAGCLGKAG